jgi:RimJ/RimL family protein N-acetyltransferase
MQPIVKAQRPVLVPAVRRVQWRIALRSVLAAHPRLVQITRDSIFQFIPDPYPQRPGIDPGKYGAETFIARELEKVAAGEEIYNWMLVLRGGDGEAIGNIRFRPGSDDAKGNRGFWLAERYWNQGLMTEAVSAVNDFAFRTLGIESYYACNAATNVASRRVKQKTGAELVGYIEIAHHSGQTLAEKWRVTRENWLRRRP